MRLRTLAKMIDKASTERLIRLAVRMCQYPDQPVRPRDMVRIVVMEWIGHALEHRKRRLHLSN